MRNAYPLFGLFVQALRGKCIWEKIKKKYRLKEDGYLFLYAGEQELFEQAMEYLPEFLEKKYANLAVVAVPDGMCVPVSNSDRRIQMAYLTTKELDALLRCYRLNSFFCHVIPLSLNGPFGSYGLLQKDGILLADLVRDYLMV